MLNPLRKRGPPPLPKAFRLADALKAADDADMAAELGAGTAQAQSAPSLTSRLSEIGEAYSPPLSPPSAARVAAIRSQAPTPETSSALPGWGESEPEWSQPAQPSGHADPSQAFVWLKKANRDRRRTALRDAVAWTVTLIIGGAIIALAAFFLIGGPPA
jgi:hypothetical protein